MAALARHEGGWLDSAMEVGAAVALASGVTRDSAATSPMQNCVSRAARRHVMPEATLSDATKLINVQSIITV